MTVGLKSGHLGAAVLKLSLPLAGISILTLAFGLLREIVIAARFGTGQAVDAYLVAALYPTFVASVFTSVISGTVVPVFHAAAAEGDEALERYVAALWTASVAILILVTVLLAVLLHPLLVLTAPGFDVQSRMLSFQLTLVMLPGGILAGLAGCLGAALNARKLFIIPALVPVLSAAAIAVTTLLFASQLGVFSIALGFVLGSVIGLMQVWISASKRGIRLRFGPILRNPHIRLTARLSVPLLLGVVTTYATLFVDRGMASSLPEGSIAALSYADKIIRLPEAILMMTVPAVLFPYLAESSVSGDLRRVSHLSSLAVVLMLIVLVPVTFIFLFLARPLVTTIFARGVFDREAVEGTSRALIGYGYGLVFLGLGYVFPRVLMALRKTLAIGLLGCLNVSLKLLFNVLLIPLFAHQGIAIASSLTYLVTDTAFVVLLWRAGIRVRSSLVVFALLAGTAIGLGVLGTAYLSSWFSRNGPLELASGGMGGLVALYLLHRAGVITRLLDQERGETRVSNSPVP